MITTCSSFIEILIGCLILVNIMYKPGRLSSKTNASWDRLHDWFLTRVFMLIKKKYMAINITIQYNI